MKTQTSKPLQAEKSDSKGLYLHIPFCSKKCHYCDFVITTKTDTGTRRQFIEALKKEIAWHAKEYGRLKFKTLYFGGGTPSLLTTPEIEEILAALQSVFDFEEDKEFTLEVNPENVSLEWAERIRALGVNRISLGVQTFKPELLQALNRTHSAEDTRKAFEFLKGVGLENISTDLMIKLPGQTLQDVGDSARELITLGAKQVAIYDLEVSPKTVFWTRQERGELCLTGQDEHAEMFEAVSKQLVKAGYDHYELCNFAQLGFQSRHNLIYWNNGEYLGLGPGAFAYLNQKRYQFAENVKTYLEKVEREARENFVEDALTPRQIEIESLLTGIRLKPGIDLTRLPVIREDVIEKSKNLIQAGYLEREAERLKFTATGKPLAESILADLAGV